MSSVAFLDGYHYVPRIDMELLEAHNKGLVCLTSCLKGQIPQLILRGDEKSLETTVEHYLSLFQDRFFLELQDNGIPEQKKVNEGLLALSRRYQIPLVATNDCHYLKREEARAHELLLCIQTGKTINDHDRLKLSTDEFYFKSPEEMERAFSAYPEALKNTLKIAEMCNLKLQSGTYHFPHFPLPDNQSLEDHFEDLCRKGYEQKIRYIAESYEEFTEEQRAKYDERLRYELEVIRKTGFAGYFLIVSDFIAYAKSQGIPVGPGRGSAAGSLAAYCLGITNIDPIKYDLLFERFLNPDRISMPDIDTDFSDIHRGEVLSYVEEKYGKEHVAQIITFGTMAARAAVRDVGRVLDYPYDYCDKLAKAIPANTKLEQAITSVPEVKELYEKEEGARKILNYAKRLEGVARHSSTHACGVLITKNPLTEYVPVQYASSSDKTLISQYSLHPVEDLGLLKMDFLGLSNLTIIESAIKIIKKARGIEVDIDKISLDDEKTYQLFQRGETTGVFQFESSGMKRYLRELKPTNFEDIIAMVALYRPGPMEWIPDYIASKHGRKRIEYLHPKLEPILSNTYGVAIYQEQVMQIARSLAGFTMGEADVLRKAMGKKIAELLAQQKVKFIEGCVKNSIAKELAEKVFSFIEPFAGYGFNRSHAACYALIGYQTAFLKAHWPTDFMAALLTSDQDNTDRIAIEIEECRNMGIDVLAPDINESFGSFTVVTSGTKENKKGSETENRNTIRFGLKAVKNLGCHIAEVIIEERKENGPYADLTNFLKRVQDKDLNKKSLEALIKSGAFDAFGERGLLLANIDNMLSLNKEISRANASSQGNLFGDLPISAQAESLTLRDAPPASRQDKLAWEKELMGLYITEHPFLDYKKYLAGVAVPLSRLKDYPREHDVTVAGIIINIKKILTKKNENMLFVKIEDDTDSVELLVFPRLLKEIPAIWTEGNVVFVRGKLSDKDEEVKLLANSGITLTIDTLEKELPNIRSQACTGSMNGNGIKQPTYGNDPYQRQANVPANSADKISSFLKNNLVLYFQNNINPETLAALRSDLAAHSGSNKVFFRIKNGQEKVNMIETDLKVSKSPELEELIRERYGAYVKILDNTG